MIEMKKTPTTENMRVILATLAIFCLLGAGFIPLSRGYPPSHTIAGLQLTSTPDSTAIVATPTTTAAHEPDVTIGLVLAGVLLMVVILFGTLHATRGLRKPPHSQ